MSLIKKKTLNTRLENHPISQELGHNPTCKNCSSNHNLIIRKLVAFLGDLDPLKVIYLGMTFLFHPIKIIIGVLVYRRRS
jgi:hypothetical protein